MSLWYESTLRSLHENNETLQHADATTHMFTYLHIYKIERMVNYAKLRGGHVIQVFERPDSYLEHSKVGYWCASISLPPNSSRQRSTHTFQQFDRGVPTSGVDWCERNYRVSYYVAEWYNTITNLLFVLLGTYGFYRSIKSGLEPRFQLLYLGVIVIGLGSAAFHGTLSFHGQQADENPMICT